MHKGLQKYYKRLGGEIREAREAKGLTQEQLSDGGHLPIRFIQQVEDGLTGPSHFARAKISAVLGVDIEAASTRIVNELGLLEDSQD